MEGVSLLFPKNPSEQQKIADTLLSSDDLINAQIQKLEALQLHKKGLLQGLFPSINNEE
jgi:type I restriction enzyme S subunit